MRVLLLGGGGREHALGAALVEGGSVDRLTSWPGNPGLAGLGPTITDRSPADPTAVVEEAAGADLVVVGPEAPLAAGVADALRAKGIPALGPGADGARLEASKAFAKEVMADAGVPTAASTTHTDRATALADLDGREPPFVVKADGLAAGKGVLVTWDRDEALDWVDRCLAGDFGPAGTTVVIEDFLDGPELSVFALCAGGDAVAFGAARDHKRLRDGDEGPNTGGMGCFSPVPEAGPEAVGEILDAVVRPVLGALADRGVDYRGFLYTGLVITHHGPSVLEFNVRMGDPEAQVILPLLATDPGPLFASVAEGSLPTEPLAWHGGAAVDVVLAADGYPESPRRGDPITGVEAAAARPGVRVFHAGTARDGDALVTAGGRVLNVVGTGADLDTARAAAYAAVDDVSFAGRRFRRDIAAGLL
ncbi:MAG: phosphoribosylamine--glycine ligase [Acidimicrobiia bacterium]|nr:phosphoribosylamine--glycine ligase [Acidimicrobiia bacterium]